VEEKPSRISLPESGSPSPSDALLARTLDQLLAAKTFSRSGQLKRLLLYMREAILANDPAAWSETAIGVHAFGRKDFHPKLDTIVRVEMRRLRQKVDEYYAAEGLESEWRLRFERNTYRPFVDANIQTVPELEPPQLTEIVIAPPVSNRFWKGVAWGAGTVAVVALLAALAWWAVARPERAPRQIAESPIWSGFRNANVTVAIGTPLFFRSEEGFERNFGANLPEDLSVAENLLLHRPAYPLWNLWTPFEDVRATVDLERFLRSLNSTSTVVSARQISYAGLAGKRTIVMGQPRGAPLLIDMMAEQNFRPPPHMPGKHFAGFVNVQPKPGELPLYLNRASGLIMQSDESSPDYALVTRIRLENGGEVLNVFGDRAQTGAYVIRRLTEPAFVSELDAHLGKSDYRSAQVVFRVDYSHSSPTGLVYTTHRLK